jgi:hypothetical protein
MRLCLICLLDKNLNLKTVHRTQGYYTFLLGEYKAKERIVVQNMA